MVNYGYDYYILLSFQYSSVTKIAALTVYLPPYVINYGNYRIRYVQLIIDRTALLKDYPKYQFWSISMYQSSSFSYGMPNDITVTDMNKFGGISQYFFYNCQ